jgi:hypothetical protein
MACETNAAGVSRWCPIRENLRRRIAPEAPPVALQLGRMKRSASISTPGLLAFGRAVDSGLAGSRLQVRPRHKDRRRCLGLKSLAGYRVIVTNLPYREQAAILAHLPPIAARDGVRVAVLARPERSSAAARRAPIHENAQFDGQVRLTKLPEWVRPAIA